MIVVVGRVVIEAGRNTSGKCFARVKLTNKALIDVYPSNDETYKQLIYMLKANNIVSLALEIDNEYSKSNKACYVVFRLKRAEIIKNAPRKLVAEDLERVLSLAPTML